MARNCLELGDEMEDYSLVRSCDKCQGVAQFVASRNERVAKALRYMNRKVRRDKKLDEAREHAAEQLQRLQQLEVQVHELQYELHVAKAQVGDEQQKLASNNQANVWLLDQVQRSDEQKLDPLRRAIETLRQEKSALEDQVHDLIGSEDRRRRIVAEAALKEAEQTEKELRSSLASADEQIKNLQEQHDAMSAELNVVKKELRVEKDLSSETLIQLEKTQAELATVNSEVETARTEIATLNESQAVLCQSNAELEEKAQALQTNLTRAVEASKIVTTEFAAFKEEQAAQMEDLRQELKQEADRAQEATLEIESLREQLERAKSGGSNTEGLAASQLDMYRYHGSRSRLWRIRIQKTKIMKTIRKSEDEKEEEEEEEEEEEAELDHEEERKSTGEVTESNGAKEDAEEIAPQDELASEKKQV